MTSRSRSKKTIPPSPAGLACWGRLFSAAEKFRILEPWQWMSEDQLIGVSDPVTGNLVFVSVMGSLGEHLALMANKGMQGLQGVLPASRSRIQRAI